MSSPLAARWEMGDVFMLLWCGWVRRVRVVRVTDTGPNTREYTLRELDNGHEVFQSEADEEVLDPHRVVRAYTEQQQGRRFGDAEGRHEGRQQVGGCDGSRWRPPGRQQEHGSDLEGSDCEVGREEADGEGLDGPVDEGRLREEQAGLEHGCGSALAEGFVLDPDRLVPSGGAALGVADDRVLAADGGQCADGGLACPPGQERLPAPQDRDRLCDVRAVAAEASVGVPVPPVGPDLLRLRDEDAPRVRIYAHSPGQWVHGCECYFCTGRIG